MALTFLALCVGGALGAIGGLFLGSRAARVAIRAEVNAMLRDDGQRGEVLEFLKTYTPADVRRFWLHLLRNMIVKSVIRVGAGYFDRDDGFFLISSGISGQSLREFTHSRLDLALQGLRNSSSIDILRP